jgi:hypothetical protein
MQLAFDFAPPTLPEKAVISIAQDRLFPGPCIAQIKQATKLIWRAEGCGVAEITTRFPTRIQRQRIVATVALILVGRIRHTKMAVISMGGRVSPSQTKAHGFYR